MGAPGSDKVLEHITRWVTRDHWAEEMSDVLADHMGAAAEDFDLEVDELVDEIGDAYFGMVMTCVFDDLLTREFEPDGRNPLDEYLRRRGWKETAAGKRYLEAMRRSVMSVYEVTETNERDHLFLKDLLRGGEPLRVEDRSASKSVVRWDRVAARVLPLKGKNYLAPGILPLQGEIADDILSIVKQMVKQGRKKMDRFLKEEGIAEKVSDDDVQMGALKSLAPVVSSLWLVAVLEAMDRPLPNLINFDGEEVVFCEVSFPVVKKDIEEIARRLDDIDELERYDDDDPAWGWSAPEAAARTVPKANKRGEAVAIGKLEDDGRRSLGSIQLHRSKLVLTANSRERAERGKALLGKTLDGLVGPGMISMQSVESLMDNPPQTPAADPGSEIPPEIAQQVVHEHLDRHYHNCMNDKIPVLRDRTPRQAAKSKTGRAELVTWLKNMENTEIRRARAEGQEPYDFAWMWQELGITELGT